MPGLYARVGSTPAGQRKRVVCGLAAFERARARADVCALARSGRQLGVDALADFDMLFENGQRE